MNEKGGNFANRVDSFIWHPRVGQKCTKIKRKSVHIAFSKYVKHILSKNNRHLSYVIHTSKRRKRKESFYEKSINTKISSHELCKSSTIN